MKLNPKTKIKRNKNIIFKYVEDTVYILDPYNTVIRTLNETASFLWNSLEKPKSINELTKLVCKEFAVSQQQAENDIKEFISNYIEEGLLLLKEE